MVDETPFWDVRGESHRFRLPRRKWRELLFVGALVERGGVFVRDPARPLPEFRDPSLFPEDASFRVRELDEKWVEVERMEAEDT